MDDPSILFASLEQKYGLPSGYLTRTYQLESGGGQNLYNDKSGAAGPFQFMPATAKQYGLTNPYDLTASAHAAARLASDNGAVLQKGGISDPTGAQLYLAHQQGATGALNLINAGDKSASGVVGDKAVAWNGGKDGVTGSGFASQIMGKYGPDAVGASPSTGLLGGDQFNAAPSPVSFPQPGANGLLAQGATMPANVPMGPQGGLNTAPSAYPSFTNQPNQDVAGNVAEGNALQDPSKINGLLGLQMLAAGQAHPAQTPSMPFLQVHRPQRQQYGLLG
jgi:hypothetical protein